MQKPIVILKIVAAISSISFTSLVFCQQQGKELPSQQAEALAFQLTKDEAIEGEARSQVYFFDYEQGDILSSRRLELAGELYEMSQNGRYALIKTEVQPIVWGEQDGILRFDLIDWKDAKLWSKEEHLTGSEDYWRYNISNMGSSVKVNSTKGVIWFFEPDGTLEAEIQVLDPGYWSRGRLLMGTFSYDGMYYVVNASDDAGETFPNKSGIFIFGKDGHKVRQFNTDYEQATNVWLSPKNDYILSTSSSLRRDRKRVTNLYDFQGNLIRRIELITNDARFTASGEHVAIILDAAQRLLVLESKTGEKVFRYTTLARGKTIYAADFNEAQQIVGFITDGELQIFNLSRRSRFPEWSKSIPASETTVGWYERPAFRFLSKPGEFVVSTKSRISQYRLSK